MKPNLHFASPSICNPVTRAESFGWGYVELVLPVFNTQTQSVATAGPTSPSSE